MSAERCSYLTASGRRCRLRAVAGQAGCRIHEFLDDDEAFTPANPSTAFVAIAVDAGGDERKLLLRPETTRMLIDASGRILGFVDGQLQQVGEVPAAQPYKEGERMTPAEVRRHEEIIARVRGAGPATEPERVSRAKPEAPTAERSERVKEVLDRRHLRVRSL